MQTLFSRRQLLQTTAAGFGSVALAAMLGQESHAADNPLAQSATFCCQGKTGDLPVYARRPLACGYVRF